MSVCWAFYRCVTSLLLLRCPCLLPSSSFAGVHATLPLTLSARVRPWDRPPPQQQQQHGPADDFDAPAGGPTRGGADKESGDADEWGGAGGTGLPSYGGQLRMKYLLSKRRNQVEDAGPEDLLILQPTSIGTGIDAGFLEVGATAPLA